MDYLKAVLTNGSVWTAAINLVGVLLFFALPDFPKEVWVSIVALVNAILAAIGIAVTLVRQARARFGSVRNTLGVVVARLKRRPQHSIQPK